MSLLRFKIVMACCVVMSMICMQPAEAQNNNRGTKNRATAQTTTSKSKKSTAQGASRSKTPARTRTKTGTGNGRSAKTSGSKVGATKSNAAKSGPRTSAEAKKQHAATQQEIARTREQIKINEAEVAKGVSELGILETEITAGRREVATARNKVAALQTRIDTLSRSITKSENEISAMRAQYLKAVKAARLKQNGNSDLMFIFSSESFAQGLRRMRYLRQFSKWRAERTDKIKEKVARLEGERKQLTESKVELTAALEQSRKAAAELEVRYARQNEVVSELKRNGSALKSHLQKKQAEANSLNSMVASLIAREQAKAEADRKAREEKARAEAEAKAKAAAEAEQNKAQLAQADKPKEKPADKPKEKTDKKTEKQPENKAAKSNNDKNYAEARKRRPRTTTAPAAPEKPKAAQPAPKSAGGGSFESMRGSLPAPVAGEFTITNRFGRHSLPDLPDVVYDNPGIDARTAKDAVAQAVFAGNVSGVYMIPGYKTVVIVNHGNYYTVYGNIEQPQVKVGDKVVRGTGLGRLARMEDDNSHSQIHFEVWRNREKLNPSEWLR